MQLVVNSANTKLCKKTEKMIEMLACGYSSDSTQRDLSNEYQHDKGWMVFRNRCIFVPRTKVALAFEGLRASMCVGWEERGGNGPDVGSIYDG